MKDTEFPGNTAKKPGQNREMTSNSYIELLFWIRSRIFLKKNIPIRFVPPKTASN